MQDRTEESRNRELASEGRGSLFSRDRELQDYLEAIERRERELDASRMRLKEEQLAREKEFEKELEAREMVFTEREKKLAERQLAFEKRLREREAEIEALRERAQKEREAAQMEILDREVQIQNALFELNKEKQRYTEEGRQKIEHTSSDYVAVALESLDKKETQFHRISKVWSTIGAGALVAGIGFFGYVSVSSATMLPGNISWEYITFTTFKGLILVVLLVGVAKYSFLFSSSYMHEALKNADRRHAINFGKFYLESYGAAADWSEIKEAFENWNIAGSNAFTRTDSTMPDITNLDKAFALIERASKAFPKRKDGNVA